MATGTGATSVGMQRYYGQPLPAPTKTSTFQPAASPNPLALPATDPRIDQLMKSLTAQQQTSSAAAPAGPDFAPINAKSSELSALMSSLMAGHGPSIGPVAGDPEAAAFRNARLREAERSRASEADRLGASGVAGSGDFDSRVAQVNEQAGSDIAGFEGALSGRRKQEALTAATTGANLQLADLSRQQTEAQATFDAEQRAAEVANARADAQAQLDRQSKSDLLSVLLNQQQFGTDTAFRTADNARADSAEARAQAAFNITEAGKTAKANQQPPNTHWDPRYGWVQNGRGVLG